MSPDPRRSHPGYDPSHPPPPPRRKTMGVEIREKAEEDEAPASLSPRGFLTFAAKHGRTWNPIGVALMFLAIIGGSLYFLNTDVGHALVVALKDNTTAVERLEAKLDAKMAKLEAKADEALAGNKAIREELKVQGQGNATKRIVVLENNQALAGEVLVKLNGGQFNTSFPRSLEGSFKREPGLPEPVFPMFTTDRQWATKPE